jgi:hypothetical protein
MLHVSAAREADLITIGDELRHLPIQTRCARPSNLQVVSLFQNTFTTGMHCGTGIV